jgi:hypothetical protein
MSARRMPHRIPIVAALAAVLLANAAIAVPVQAGSGTEARTADLDGRPIALAQVGTLHCQDFDHPRIHCFTTAAALDASLTQTLAATGISYVQIFENASYGGASMYVSDDYSALSSIGWNDRISSYKAVNSETGTFFTDWFYGGSSYGFCCNQNVSSLGGFNDTFSSVRRT